MVMARRSPAARPGRHGRGLARTAIINFAAGLNVEIHTPYHAYALEARMAKIGHADNHVIWRNGPGDIAWNTMDAWLAEIDCLRLMLERRHAAAARRVRGPGVRRRAAQRRACRKPTTTSSAG